jgi:hypothetical protein
MFVRYIFLNGSLGNYLYFDVRFSVRFINDVELVNKKPKYFVDLTQGVAVYFLLSPTGDTIIGFNHGSSDALCFGCQILISGFNTDIKIRNCAWATEWSEWRTL